MSAAITEVLDLIHNQKIKFIDLRFTDVKGKEQHLTVMASIVDEDFFHEGKMFDGSSIQGFKAAALRAGH